MRESFLEVDLNAINYNIKEIKKMVGKDVEIMPVIKSDAYGLGAKELQEIINNNNINIVAVAILDEANQLKQYGYKQDIFILNEQSEEELEQIIENEYIVGVSRIEIAKKLNEYAILKNKKSRVHIRIDTGMNRTGIHKENVATFINEIKKLENVKIEGLYTHFASADTDYEFTKKQIKEFEEVIEILKKEKIELKYIHAAASSGLINFPEARYNLVRPGLIIYGYLPDESLKEKIKLKPTTKLKSEITFLKEVSEGEKIGYSGVYKTNKKTKIATIPIGYADGVRRSLSVKGEVVINNKKAPIAGNICMDNLMIDVTNIEDIKVGDKVYIWDNEIITLEEVAKKCDTINYEILCGLSKRVPRKFIK